MQSYSEFNAEVHTAKLYLDNRY